MISRLEANNFRCLRGVSLALDRFHVIAGPNGSGKSTLLEVARLLSAFAGSGTEALLDASLARQIPELLFRGEGTSFQLAMELPVPDEVLNSLGRKPAERPTTARYEIEIGGRDLANLNEPQIFAENLWLLDPVATSPRQYSLQSELVFPASRPTPPNLIHGQSKTPAGWRKVASKPSPANAYFKSETSDWNFTFKNGPQRSALSSLPEDERFGIGNWVKTQITTALKKLALRSEFMQATCPPLKARGFSPDGSTLPLVVRELRQEPAAYAAWIDQLHTVLPIRDVAVIERPEDRHTYLAVTYDDGLQVPSWHLSDGTLRLMALTLLAYVRSEGDVFLIEEPENGVHPQAVEAVFQSLSSLYQGQVLLATHSPVLVGLIKPEQLLCFAKTPGGETDIVRGDQHPRLRAWQGELRLAQLFAAGILS